ncbi:MAG TPA: aldo/keto reductase [Mycobacteriales bacterium]|jgi:aryl-alcohol dehydrogenase-like predicted oxidoreductase|nr:aldo/keto reductase [Mycobacteriales bacterium]
MTDMRYRRLGDSGLQVPVVGLGCNNFGTRTDRDASFAVIDAALDAGVSFFDTADIYGKDGASETIIGEALKGRRDQVVLASKFGMPTGDSPYQRGGSRHYVRRAVEASLTRLQTDYLDLYQLHEPDPHTPIDETLSVLDDLVREGKVRYIGSSNFAGWQVADADWMARDRGHTRFVSAQNKYSLLDREVEADLVPACEVYGVGVLPFFPLAQGLLTGKFSRGAPLPAGTRLANNPDRAAAQLTDERLTRVEQLEAYAAKRYITLLHVAIGGLAAQPMVSSVIAGATSPDQVRANAEAGLWSPDEDDLAALDEIVPSPRPA